MSQFSFKFNIPTSYTLENYLISSSNNDAYQYLFDKNNKLDFVFLYGPKKSGKTHLSSIWCNKNNSLNLILKNIKINKIINLNKNIFIDDVFLLLEEEKLFHLINHCKINKLKILLSSNLKPSEYKFESNDLSSRIRSFTLVKIYQPDDLLISNLMIKLFNDRQIYISDRKVIPFITQRINRTFEDVYKIVDKIDKFSLNNKKEITIPLIKKII